VTDDLLELLEAELEGLDEQALDRELAELVERLAAEPPRLRARRSRRPPYRRRPIELVCVVCDSRFLATRRDALTCTALCRKRLWRERHAAR
jgi:hypothetical protein